MARKYSDEEKAAALAALKANGGNLKKTAREAGVPVNTLRAWAGQLLISPPGDPGPTPKKGGSDPAPGPSPALVAAANQGLADKLEAICHKAAGVVDGKLDDLTAQQAAVVLGIAVDKMRLLREQPTSISGAAGSLTDDERLARLRELAERARARRAAATAPLPEP